MHCWTCDLCGEVLYVIEDLYSEDMIICCPCCGCEYTAEGELMTSIEGWD